MKKTWLCILALLLVLTGCTQSTPPHTTSSTPSTPTNVSSVPSSQNTTLVALALPATEEWTWNTLYDYLENPRQSGDFSFSEENGERIALFDLDGVTELSTKWNTPIAQNMTVRKYNQQGELLVEYQIHLLGQTTSSSPNTNNVTSKPAPVISGQQVQKQEIVLSVYEECTALEQVVLAFNKQSKTTEVLLTKTAGYTTADQLKKAKKEGTLSDLVLMNHKELTLARKEKLLSPLTKTIPSVGTLSPALLTHTTQNSQIYGLPVGAQTNCLAANQELLYRAGAKVPTTFEELLENASLLQEKLSGVTPIGLTTNINEPSTMAEEFSLFLKGNGGTVLTPDNQTAAFYSKSGIDALTLYQELLEQNLISLNHSRKDFYNQNVGYGIVSSADYEKTFGKKAKSNYIAAPLVSPGNQPLSYMELYSFCMPAGISPENQKAVLEFLKFYYRDASYSVTLCQQQGWVPALLEAQTHKSYQTDAWAVFLTASTTAMVEPPLPCYNTIETYLAECVYDVLAGEDKELCLERAWTKSENRLARG